jgi:hypothetical protein
VTPRNDGRIGARVGPPRAAERRSVGAILRARTPLARSPEVAAPVAPVARSWGRRLLGAALLLATVTLVSCQALLTAFSPGLYG